MKIGVKEQKAIDSANAVKDNVPEEVKKQARQEARLFASQILEEEKNLAFYQQEREKLNVDWIVSKKDLEDQKGELINKEREVEDLKENHIMTINLYKQRYFGFRKGQTYAFLEPGLIGRVEEGCRSYFEAE